MRIWIAAAAALLIAPAGRVRAQELTVAAASDLQPALPRVAAQFQQETGHAVRISYGSSGNFFTQIQNGAPFDVLLSADADYPRRLADSGHAIRETLTTYALGALVLWTRTDSGIDVSRGWAAVTDPRVQRIAIANPEHAPYGRAAIGALKAAGVFERVRDKLVNGENIAQAAQFAQSGNAQIGILALSNAFSEAFKSTGSYWTIPLPSAARPRQVAVVLATTRQRQTAQDFVRFLTRPDIARLLAGFGFTTDPALLEAR
jgi:molybdate transport system substrate-binding protein